LLDDKDEIDARIVESATNEQLYNLCEQLLIKYDSEDSDITDKNRIVVGDVLSGIRRDARTGRLIVPALWKNDLQHLLSHNYRLALSILNSNKKRLSNSKLLAYDSVVRDQFEEGMIERVDLEKERRNVEVSYLPHSAVFKEESNSTKLRVVFLSNLKENQSNLSHNQISSPGVCLNHKLQIALTLLRFDKFLFTFDLRKAFLQLLLNDEDTLKLRFLWYNDVSKNDFSVVSYKMCRVPFGMRYSPFLLMISLYYILIHKTVSDTEYDKTVKRCIYDLAYVDNLGYSSNESLDLINALNLAVKTFKEYGFDLQQFSSNSKEMKSYICAECGETVERDSKLLGMTWNTDRDTLRNRKCYLDPSAVTRRQILSSLQSNFDPFGLNIPLMNRAKLFLHKIQCDIGLGWDTRLNVALLKEWSNIAKQVNKASVFEIDRSVGGRADLYSLLMFSDASKNFLGCVVYALNRKTNSTKLVLARNSLVSKSLKTKSIPMLELAALQFGVQTVAEIYSSLTMAVNPISIDGVYAFTDSVISLCWIRSKEVCHDKIDKKNVFINNKLDAISDTCAKMPVVFDHVSGELNPSDCLTRTMSDKQLANTSFLSGPTFNPVRSEHCVSVPYVALPTESQSCIAVAKATMTITEPLIQLDRFSSFKRAVKVMFFVLKFLRIKCKYKSKMLETDSQIEIESSNYVIKCAQQCSFPEVYQSLAHKKCDHPLVSQLNLLLDPNGVIRVQSQLKKLKLSYEERCPVLLDKRCPVARAVVLDAHNIGRHSGIYKTLAIMRRQFWITNAFVLVKNVIKECLICRKLNNRTIKFNKNSYRDFRVNPEAIPYRNIAIDHCGPYYIKNDVKVNEKVYILVITCFWSRSVNLLVCRQINKEWFLRALQLHVFEHGIPTVIVSDNGSPIVAGVRDTISYLDDAATAEYLRSNNIRKLESHPYPAGASELGGFVEALVKQVKKLLNCSIGRNILSLSEFEYFVAEAKMLINKRPIAFANSLDKLDTDTEAFGVITPEMIVKGKDIPVISIVPPVGSGEVDCDFVLENHNALCVDRYRRLQRVRSNLEDLYAKEFVTNLMYQATGRKDAFKRKTHIKLKPGDLVSLRTPNTKPYDYPLAVVVSVEVNDLEEVVAVTVRKANSAVVRRHVSDVIFLSETDFVPPTQCPAGDAAVHCPQTVRARSKRSAAVHCEAKNKVLLQKT